LKIRDEDLGFKDAIGELSSLSDSTVEVGVLAKDGSTPHRGTLKESGKTVRMADIAAWNEFGAGGTPQRPFLSSTMDDESVLNAIANITKAQLSRGKSIQSLLDSVGKRLKREVRKSIRNWSTPANSVAWAAKKGKNDPLVWTGQLLRTIDYEAKQGKKRFGK
jgi:hypothetical protein